MKPKVHKLLLISLLLTSLYSTAQPFQPFILPGKHWNVMNTNLDGGAANSATTFKYWITENDTVINDTIYKIVYSQGDWMAENGIIGFLREEIDGGKVFFRSLGNIFSPDKDQLLYDFSVDSGSIVNVYGMLSCSWQSQPTSYLVTSIGDTTLLNGELKKTWYLQPIECCIGQSDIWIEDIGSLNGMLFPGCYMFATTSFKRDLLCYGENEQDLYFSELDTCFVDWITGISQEFVQQPRVYPNPANEYVVFEMQKPILPGTITISDITGREVDAISVNGEKVVWDTRQIEKGVYVYTLKVAGFSQSGKLIVVK